MDFYKVPIGFALSANTAAMNKEQKQAILHCVRNVHSEEEMYSLAANLANGGV